jgi:hypothetical protein
MQNQIFNSGAIISGGYLLLGTKQYPCRHEVKPLALRMEALDGIIRVKTYLPHEVCWPE